MKTEEATSQKGVMNEAELGKEMKEIFLVSDDEFTHLDSERENLVEINIGSKSR